MLARWGTVAAYAGGIVVAVLVQADAGPSRGGILRCSRPRPRSSSRRPEGSGRRVANFDRMSETENRTEPHVSTEELRAALTPRGETRRNPVLVSERDEGELKQLRAALETADSLRTELDASRRLIDSARADAIELRAALDAARGDAHELRLELMRARAEAAERRDALSKLANAGFFRRRKVMAELKERNAF